MSCVKDMLSVLMDGIKDAEMVMEYAATARTEAPEWMMWFKNHVKIRLDQLDSDYDYVCRAINLNEKSRSGDEIAEALKSHLEMQIEMLHKKYDML